jgi:tetratricopeptide (TPR) repeat protein
MPTPPTVSVGSVLDRASDFARNGRLAVFCGAGISKPSGLPDAVQMVRAILDWTSMSAAEKDWIASVVPSKLPFERLMETVLDAMGERDKRDFLSVFRLGQPAIVHSFIAAASKRGHLNDIFTTNFDCHIETALARAELKLGTDVIQYHRIAELAASMPAGKTLHLTKLHGTVDNPAEMAINVRTIAKMEAVGAMTDVITRALSQSQCGLLVFGYSFSDRFDISPALEAASKRDPKVWVLVVDHDTGVEATSARFVSFETACDLPHPLRAYPTALRLRADTAWVIRELSVRLGIEIHEGKPCSSVAWSAFLNEFAQGLDDRSGGLMGDAMSGLLLAMTGAHEAAIPYLRSIVTRAATAGTDQVRLVTSQALIESLSGAGHLDEARDLALQTEPLARTFDGGLHADTVLSYLGSIYKQVAEQSLVRSRDYFHEAAQIAAKDGVGLRSVPHIAGIAAAWMRLGDMDAALAWYMQSYEAVKVSGDPSRHAEVCGNIASLYYMIREYEDALAWYEKALDLSRLSGDQRNVGIHLMNRANVFVKQRRFEVALVEYGRARQEFREGDPLLTLLDSHAGAAERMAADVKEREANEKAALT